MSTIGSRHLDLIIRQASTWNVFDELGEHARLTPLCLLTKHLRAQGGGAAADQLERTAGQVACPKCGGPLDGCRVADRDGKAFTQTPGTIVEPVVWLYCLKCDGGTEWRGCRP